MATLIVTKLQNFAMVKDNTVGLEQKNFKHKIMLSLKSFDITISSICTLRNLLQRKNSLSDHIATLPGEPEKGSHLGKFIAPKLLNKFE